MMRYQGKLQLSFFLHYINSSVSYHPRVLSATRWTPSLTAKDYNLRGGQELLEAVFIIPAFTVLKVVVDRCWMCGLIIRYDIW